MLVFQKEKTGFLVVFIIVESSRDKKKSLKTNAYRLPLLTAHYSSFISAWHFFCCRFRNKFFVSVYVFLFSRSACSMSLICAEDAQNGFKLCLSKLEKEENE